MKHLVAPATLALLALMNSARSDTTLTIYNQDFAVVRDTVPLDLKSGLNAVSFANVTAQAETDSVILRDPAGKFSFQILEQAYRNDPVSAMLLLDLNEGKTIEFVRHQPQKADEVLQGKIIRSGYNPGCRTTEPVIEVDGKLQFSLPGEPRFPSLGDDTVLNPTLSWVIQSKAEAKFDAQLAYITGGLTWESDYNIVAADSGDTVDLVGWITFKNESGRTFRDTRVKLMAGDVNRVAPAPDMRRPTIREFTSEWKGTAVTEKAFDEFHLYTIGRPVTLRDRETKQVEFVRATSVKAPRIYVYDGATMEFGRWSFFRGAGDYGIPTNKKVWTLREFKNSKENKLGMALPKGRLRFYRQDNDDQSLEFTGENSIDHTAKDELIRVYLGNSFDLAGERRRTEFKVNNSNNWLDETFEIKIRNHKKEPVEIRVVEHLTRFDNWEMREKSHEFRKLDSHTIEFPVTLKPDEEAVVTYKIHYSW
jgi:hypothetical protein